MLLSLSIRNFVIVESLELDFSPGFTVLSGETGAGKSILIDALLLALGERGEADVVREGAQRAEITAEFRPGEYVQHWLVENDLAGEDGCAGAPHDRCCPVAAKRLSTALRSRWPSCAS